jgi:hypothetical protein
MMFNKRIFAVSAAIVTIAAAGACGKKKKSATVADSSTAANPVSSLSLIPDTSTVTTATTTALTLDSADAVTGTPPLFSAITTDKMETYFTGTIADMITGMKDAKAAADWDKVKTYVDSFRAAGAKCQQVEDVARALTVLNENTSDLCYMQQVGAVGAGVLDYTSGDTVDDGAFFKPKADGTNVVRQITYGKDVRKFRIYGSTEIANGYKVAFARCVDDKPKNYSVVTVDNTAGTFVLTNIGGRPLQTNMTSDDFSFTLKAGLSYDSASGAYVFNTAAERSFESKNYRVETTRSNTVNANITVAADTITSLLFMKDINSGMKDREGVARTQTSVRKGINYANFGGTSVNNVYVSQGAGYQYSSQTNDGLGSGVTMVGEATVGFEFNNTKTPQYDSVTTGTYVDAVTTKKAGIDTLAPFSALAEPVVPDVMPADATTLCGTAATAVYQAKPRESDAVKAIETTCDGKRNVPGGRSLCNGIRNQESIVMQYLNERRTAKGVSGTGN